MKTLHVPHPFAPLAAAALLVGAAGATPQNFGVDFASDYTYTDLGSPPMVPGPLGGVIVDPADSNRLLIGGSANNSAGVIFSVGIDRDVTGRITGFDGTSSQVATAPNIDGGLVFGPGGVMIATGYPNNTLLQYLPGSTQPDRIDDLSALGINSSTGTCQFVPMGFAGAGRFLVASYNSSDWYEVTLTPDGNGTFDLSAGPILVNTGGGPEGIVFIEGGNPGFTDDSALISEYGAGAVRAYDLDANGDPDPATRRDFLTGLTGAEGATIDPITGDFIFSTFGGGNRVIVVEGFDGPSVFCDGKVNSAGCTPTISWTGSPTLTGPDDFVIDGADFTNGEFGVLVHSTMPDAVPFGGGTLCVGGPTYERPAMLTGGTAGPAGVDCSGVFQTPITQGWMAMNGYTAGTTVFLQYVARDTGYAAGDAISLSDGLRFTVGM